MSYIDELIQIAITCDPTADPGNGDAPIRRAIEVQGRANTGDVEVSSNEWARAANLRDGYWLYAVDDYATPAPRLARVQDPFGSLLAKAKGSVLISAARVQQASTPTR